MALTPLAERLRPQRLDDYIDQAQLDELYLSLVKPE